MSGAIKLRPHHLLCTQGYSGKGYDDDFIANMTAVTNRLRNEENTEVQIVFSTDDICAKCPKMAGTDRCGNNKKVKTIDKKVREYFGIEEKVYIYREITEEINAKMTQEIMDDICGSCSWYPVSRCKSRILNLNLSGE